MVLDGPLYISDEDEEHFIVDESFYQQNNQGGHGTSFLYEPATDNELQNRGFHQTGNARPSRQRGDGASNSELGAEREEGKRNERKYGMILPTSNDRERSDQKSTESGDKMPRKLSRTRNQRAKQDGGEKSHNEEKEKKYEIVNFGLV